MQPTMPFVLAQVMPLPEYTMLYAVEAPATLAEPRAIPAISAAMSFLFIALSFLVGDLSPLVAGLSCRYLCCSLRTRRGGLLPRKVGDNHSAYSEEEKGAVRAAPLPFLTSSRVRSSPTRGRG